jgi:hypothetical protein
VLSINVRIKIYKTIILPVPLYGCETLSLTLGKNRALRLYTSLKIIRMMMSRKMRWAGHVSRMREKRNACTILVGKPTGKRLLVKHRHRCDGNIEMDLRETGWIGMYWILLSQDREQWCALVNTVVNLLASKTVGEFLSC